MTAILLAALLAAGCGGSEASKERYLAKANALVAAEDYELAQVELRNALQIDPNFVPALLLMGRVAEQLGDAPGALQMYSSALDLDASSIEARVGMGKLFVLAGLPERALEAIEPGLVSAPRDPRLLTVRSAARARFADLAAAIADAELALSIDRSAEDTVALLASLYMLHGRADDARTLVESAVAENAGSVDLRIVLSEIYLRAGDAAGAERMLRQVVEIQPKVLPHRFRLARFQVAEHRIDEAERTLRAAVDAIPESTEAKRALTVLLVAHRSEEAAEKELLGFTSAAPQALDLSLLLGDFYRERGRDDEAAKVYRDVVRRDATGPEGVSARNRLAALALAQKRDDEALRLVDEVLALNSQDSDALIVRADLALSRGDPAAAIGDLRAVLRNRPDSVPVQRALARALLKTNDVALAQETLEKAVAAHPEDAGLRVDLARVQHGRGQTERALQSLEDLASEAPAQLAAQELLFDLQMQRGEYESARATALAVKAARPDLPLGEYLIGLVHRAEGKTEVALEAFYAALKLQPNAAEPLVAAVGLLVDAKRVDEALARLAAVTRERPDHVVAWNLSGEVLATKGRFPEAIAAFETAVRGAPGWWVPYRGKAVAQAASGDSAAATLTLEAGFEATRQALPLGSDLAAVYERLGQVAKAISVYENLHRAAPDNPVVANNLAMLLATHRDDRASLERALSLTESLSGSDVAPFLDTRGWVLYRVGRLDEAVALLRRAVDLQPDSALNRYHLAMALMKAGDKDEARRNLEAALASGVRFPGHDEARTTLEALKRT